MKGLTGVVVPFCCKGCMAGATGRKIVGARLRARAVGFLSGLYVWIQLVSVAPGRVLLKHFSYND